jgi:hypothetical protein
VRCAASTSKGRPCRGHAVEGSTLCSSHLRLAGRKTSLTPQLADRLEGLFRTGTPVATAVAAVGLARSTYYDWLDRGEGEQSVPRLAAFRARMELARGEGEAVLVARISRAAAEDWRAAAWLLERGAPARWARPSQRPEEAPSPAADDPFAEFDELAARRAHAGR